MPNEPRPKAIALDPMGLPARTGTGYPEPYKRLVHGREKRQLGEAFGLKNFGVNLVRLPPGAASSLRHWHTRQDEFVYVIEGELVLVTNPGEQVLRAGMIVGWPAGCADGHHLINRSTRDAFYLEVGDRTPGDCVTYPDVDLRADHESTKYVYAHKDGRPY